VDDDLVAHHHGTPSLSMLSLDAPRQCNNHKTNERYETPLWEFLANRLTCPARDQREQTYPGLYLALEKLSPTRRALIAQRFGLLGCSETPLQEMASTRREQQRISKA